MSTTLLPPVTARPLTYDDLVQMPEDGKRYEIVGGELFVGAQPARKHKDLDSRISFRMMVATDNERLGRVYTSPGVRLSPNDIVEPDVVFLRRDRLSIYRGNLIEGPPDIVVEILSPSTRAYDQVRKAALYARAGVPEYWQADPEVNGLRLLVLGEDGLYRLVPPDGDVLRSTVLPGLEFDIAELYADLD